MTSDKEFSDSIHLLIHAARLLQGYAPSSIERKISKLVIEKYSSSCRECREAGERIKNHPEQQSFLKKLGGILDGN